MSRIDPPEEVHVWRVRLDVADWRCSLAPARLSDDEILRVRRFPFDRERRRFAVCRSTLRAILGAYLETPPRELSFRAGPYGKPSLNPKRHGRHIRFNVSHSDELALVAIGREREVGVDVELVRPLDGIDEIVARHFAPAEQLAFSRVGGTVRLSAFYRSWTIKEAYLKACGVGMSRPLNEVEVASAEQRPTPFQDSFAIKDETCWSGRMLAPAPRYVAALIVEGRSSRVRQKDWTGNDELQIR